jgi:hypothetical protein
VTRVKGETFMIWIIAVAVLAIWIAVMVTTEWEDT